ncbi:MAG: hypothetical protein N5P05_001819 [Chroococcopsis gigantea SAG 12.99]|jgi:SAM-dependent MidA family methyltransferase|nr:hypothetical protein [Chroococcopsis gigantea SAG 12.99]
MNNRELQEIITETIKSSSDERITFAQYMALALYHPQHGYYSSGAVKIGNRGDFFTSSSLGPDFGQLLAEQFLEIGQILGESLSLVEVGAGNGSLAGDILDYLATNATEFYKHLHYIIIEESPVLREIQKVNLEIHRENGCNLSWESWEDIDNNSLRGCIFSNELIDAFPVHKIVLEKGELKEIYVAIGEPFAEVIGNLSTPELALYFQRVDIDINSGEYPDGYVSEINLEAVKWIERAARKLDRGYMITIDYGYPARKYYHPQRYRGTLKCYYQHQHHDDPYTCIGNQDITTHVDFTALEKSGEEAGLKNLGYTQQGMFLMALGLGERLLELSGGGYDFQTVIRRRDALHQLIDPSGLGGFGVLIGSKGLTPEQENRSLKGLRAGGTFL